MNLKKFGKVPTSKSVGTGPSCYEKRIYRAAFSQRLRDTALDPLASRTHDARICIFSMPVPDTDAKYEGRLESIQPF